MTRPAERSRPFFYPHYEQSSTSYIRHSEEVKKEVDDKLFEEKLEALKKMQEQLEHAQKHLQLEQLHNYLEAQHLKHKNLAQAHQKLRLHL